MIAELSVAIPVAVICLVLSAFCSAAGVALFSIRRIEREQLARTAGFTDRRISAMLARPRQLIATVLIGNEVFNSGFAVLAYVVLCRWYETWSAFWIAIAVALPMIVLVTELTAKMLAAKTPLLWARLCVLPLAAFELAITPARWIVQLVAGAVLRPLGIAARARPAHDLSEEEFRTLVDAGSAQGQVNASERRLIHRVFEFSDKNVGQVMTPRERIFALSYELPAQRLVKELAARGFSRVPIYQKSLDNVRGILNAKDLVRTTAGQPLGRPLGELLHEPLFVPRTTPIKRLFLTFKQKKVHMAIVVSEYGKVLGLVTMDDLLAQIFGVLRDERAALQSSIPPGAGTAGRPAIRTADADAALDGAALPGGFADGSSSGGPLGPDELDDSGVVRLADAAEAGQGDGTYGGPNRRPSSRFDAGPNRRPSSRFDAGPHGESDGGFDGELDDGRDDGLVHRGVDRSGAISHPGMVDPPPRPAYDVEEVTPPATDLAELGRREVTPPAIERSGADDKP
ncbi:MAG TPA: hemolysin family protein [Kofleriaceae bacterium]|nr:hemolysin family protein [Kofleriaceae bacterium]